MNELDDLLPGWFLLAILLLFLTVSGILRVDEVHRSRGLYGNSQFGGEG